MVRALIPMAAVLMAFAGVCRAEGRPQTPLEGLWLVQDRDGVVAIRPCGNGPDLCGAIVGHNLDPGDPLPLDVNGQPQCGGPLIGGLKEIDPGVWDGDIRDPRDGKIYSARLRMDDEGRLRLRGYILVPLFGSTQVWTRWTGTVTPDCRMVPKP